MRMFCGRGRSRNTRRRSVASIPRYGGCSRTFSNLYLKNHNGRIIRSTRISPSGQDTHRSFIPQIPTWDHLLGTKWIGNTRAEPIPFSNSVGLLRRRSVRLSKCYTWARPEKTGADERQFAETDHSPKKLKNGERRWLRSGKEGEERPDRNAFGRKNSRVLPTLGPVFCSFPAFATKGGVFSLSNLRRSDRDRGTDLTCY